jgi:hypothetical protein
MQHADFMELLSNGDSDKADGIDWSSNFENGLSTWTFMDDIRFSTNGGTNVDGSATENLLQSSFDTWDALEGTFQRPIGNETIW